MKAEYINPFIEAVCELFSKKLDGSAERGDINVFWELPPSSDLVVIIGLSGHTKGTVVMSFPVATALSIVSQMLGREIRVVDDTVKDGIVEVAKNVAGAAKEKLPKREGAPINLSLPTVVRGNDYKLDYPAQAAWLEVPFNSNLGPFSLRVTFESNIDNG